MTNWDRSTIELLSVIRLLLEAACFGILAVAATLAIAGIRTSLEPTANPTGMTEIGYALVALGLAVALWRFARRSRQGVGHAPRGLSH